MARGVYSSRVVVRRRLKGYGAPAVETATLTGAGGVAAAGDCAALVASTPVLDGLVGLAQAGTLVALTAGVTCLLTGLSATGTAAEVSVTGTATASMVGAVASALARPVSVTTGPVATLSLPEAVASVGAMVARASAAVSVAGVQGMAHVGAAQGYSQPPQTFDRLEFAEIPEIVFVRGYDETVDLGPFLLDADNLWTPGDLTNAGGWVSRFAVSLVGTTESRLAWNDTTMRLTYTGAGDVDNTQHHTVQLSVAGVLSRSFIITVVRPSVTWGFGGTVNLTGHVGTVGNASALSWNSTLQTYGNPGGTTVLLIMPGTYLNKTGTSVTWVNQVTAAGRVYVIGRPDSRPVLQYDGVTFIFKPNGGAVWCLKNIEVDGSTPSTTSQGVNFAPAEAQQYVAWGIEVTQTGREPFERTRMGDTASAGPMLDYAASEHFYHGIRLRRTGRLFDTHGVYAKNGSWNTPNDQLAAYTFANRTLTHINCSDFGATPAGHTLKLEGASTLRNTWVHSADDESSSTLTTDDVSGYAPVNLHVNHRTILWNNKVDHIWTTTDGQRWPIYTGSRNSAEGGQTFPPYYGVSVIASNPRTHVGLAALPAGELFHGSGAALGTVYASPPTDVPWWNLVGYRPQGDRLSVYHFQHWLAYNHVRTPDVSDRVATQRFDGIAHRLDSSAVHQDLADETGSGHWYLNVPRNWRSMSGAYLLNNRYENFTSRHVTDDGFGAVSTSLTVYPECVLPLPTNTITVLSDEAANETDVPIPDWFVLSYDAVPTNDLKATADTIAAGAGAFFITPLANELVAAGESTPTDTELAIKANSISGGGFSVPLVVPDLATLFPRLDPEFPQAYPDMARNKKAWHWAGKATWDPVTRRVLAIHSPHQELDNLYAQLLLAYDERQNKYRVYENPIQRSVGHMFDTNGIDAAGRKLYKWTVPRTVTGQGQIQPQLCVVNVDAINIDVPASAQQGAALITEIARRTDQSTATAPGLDYFPGVGVCLYSRSSVWVWDDVAWSEPIATGVAGTIHNLAHYNPDWDCLVFGGGSFEGSASYSLAWFTMDASRVITRLDDSPVPMSVNNADMSDLTPQWPTHKCCATWMPGRSRSIVFHNDGNIYALDKNAPAGSQWSVVGANDADGGSVDRWCVPIPDHFCILHAHYGPSGTSALKAWKLP